MLLILKGKLILEKLMQLSKLNMRAHTESKQRAREQTLVALRAAIEADDAQFRAMAGLQSA